MEPPPVHRSPPRSPLWRRANSAAPTDSPCHASRRRKFRMKLQSGQFEQLMNRPTRPLSVSSQPPHSGPPSIDPPGFRQRSAFCPTEPGEPRAEQGPRTATRSPVAPRTVSPLNIHVFGLMTGFAFTASPAAVLTSLAIHRNARSTRNTAGLSQTTARSKMTTDSPSRPGHKLGMVPRAGMAVARHLRGVRRHR